MLPFAVARDGTAVRPQMFDGTAWEELKRTYRIGDFTTPCCQTPAIPKTSINGFQFFAHHTDECITSPESVWHVETKARLVAELEGIGCRALLERPVSGDVGKLVSDVYFEFGGRRVAIEVQHSYQTFARYRERQRKYGAHGIHNYWLVKEDRFRTIVKAIAQYRIRTEFGRVFPNGVSIACLPDLPMAIYDPEVDGGTVRGVGGWRVSVGTWLGSVATGSFCFDGDTWRIS